ncbi:endonuclease [Weeksellaceae bacterium KMM 9724]|uniref:endonuclease/exonuclease/phosphatase family protein n=1 Tax=Profundicola chukchiensis TaxID=2961959 RepID=UPI002438A98D|nr:endonuclease [Profundicola chukchiensis]MDG4949408.1 endonuclease [Profundicola chukchiensis]
MNILVSSYKFKKDLAYLVLVFLFISNLTIAQENQFQAATVGFYNVENLFDIYPSAGLIDGNKDYQDEFYHINIKREDIPKYDTVDCKCRLTEENLKGKKVVRELILIDEFTPDGPKAWDETKYNQKLRNLSKVISEMGADVTGTAPVVVGLAEVESREVIEDLIAMPLLQPFNYGVVHYNSLDKRGIDVGLIYQKDRVVVTKTQKYELEIYNTNGRRDYTRDILRVDALLDGEPMHFLVNHWPSRRGGEAASSHKREAAAELMLSIFNEIREEDKDAKIISVGDFNDDPNSPSIKNVLNSVDKKRKVKDGDIFNATGSMFEKGFGTLAYRDGWNLFDQILTSSSLVGDDYDSYQLYRTEIFSPLYLVSREGSFKGYPNRMYGGDTYNANGYSDHFPVYSILLRKVKK